MSYSVENASPYSGIDPALKATIFDGCYDSGLRGEDLTNEVTRQFRIAMGVPLADIALANAQAEASQPVHERIPDNTDIPPSTPPKLLGLLERTGEQ